MVTRRQLRRAIELHAGELSSRDEVVGVGASWDTSKVEKGRDREHAIAVYVSSLTAADKADQTIPTSVEIPARKGVHLIPVVVKEVGEIEPEASTSRGREPDDGGEELFFAE